MPMIPTRLKAKLPKRLSYPIGAEAISAALTGITHFDELTLNFWNEPVWPGSEFRRLIKDSIPYTILAAEYEPPVKPGYGGKSSLINGWKITIYPVVRALKHLAHRLLMEQGLPLVVDWLGLSRQGGWISRAHRLELVFEPKSESLSQREIVGV